MVTKFETQARKKPKLNKYIDLMDFQIILVVGLFGPVIAWYLTGVNVLVAWIPIVCYMVWIGKYKINKPLGYGFHMITYRARSGHWTAVAKNKPKKLYLELSAESFGKRKKPEEKKVY